MLRVHTTTGISNIFRWIWLILFADALVLASPLFDENTVIDVELVGPIGSLIKDKDDEIDSDDWMKWTATDPRVVLEPDTDWEGANLTRQPSVRGFSMKPVRQLRDPALFETDGQSYLFYSVAGESGIAIAEIYWD